MKNSKHTAALEDQRALVERLMERKENNATASSKATKPPQEDALQDNDFTMNTFTPLQPQQPQKSTVQDPNTTDELEAYNILISKMLSEINSCKSKLENTRHRRMRKGVLDIHDSEVIRFQLSHGHEVLKRFDKSLFEYVHGCSSRFSYYPDFFSIGRREEKHSQKLSLHRS